LPIHVVDRSYSRDLLDVDIVDRPILDVLNDRRLLSERPWRPQCRIVDPLRV
jgi:hypothetical protein